MILLPDRTLGRKLNLLPARTPGRKQNLLPAWALDRKQNHTEVSAGNQFLQPVVLKGSIRSLTVGRRPV